MNESIVLLLEILSFFADNPNTGESYRVLRDSTTNNLFVQVYDMAYHDSYVTLELRSRQVFERYKEIVELCRPHDVEGLASSFLLAELTNTPLSYSLSDLYHTFRSGIFPPELQQFYETKDAFEARTARTADHASKVVEPSHDGITTSVSERWKNSGLYKFLLYLLR